MATFSSSYGSATWSFDDITATKISADSWAGYCRSSNLGSNPATISAITDITPKPSTGAGGIFGVGYSYNANDDPSTPNNQANYEEGAITYGIYFYNNEARVQGGGSNFTWASMIVTGKQIP